MLRRPTPSLPQLPARVEANSILFFELSLESSRESPRYILPGNQNASAALIRMTDLGEPMNQRPIKSERAFVSDQSITALVRKCRKDSDPVDTTATGLLFWAATHESRQITHDKR
jgi:hypothetical protein